MEIIALAMGIFGISILFIISTDDYIFDDLKQKHKFKIITIICIIIGQIFWFPIFMSPKIETETYITTQYEDIKFDIPMKLIIIKKTKPFSAYYNDQTIIEVEFLKE